MVFDHGVKTGSERIKSGRTSFRTNSNFSVLAISCIVVFATVIIIWSPIAHAAGGASSYLFGQDTLQGFVSKLVNWIAYVVGPLIVSIMIIYAGFQYIASRGNEAQVKEAKDRIVGSIVGYILLMLIGAIMRAVF